MMHMKTLKSALFYLAFLWLAGCSTVPVTPPLESSWSTRESQLKHLKSWKLQGLVAVHSTQESGSASLTWEQHASNYTLSLFGPLGSNAVKIEGKPGLVTLQNSQGTYSASNPEELLFNQLGWKLPISHLHYWIRGLPVPGVASDSKFDHYQRLTTLTQQDWHIEYKQYAVFEGLELPTKMVITYPQLHIKIIIYRWNPFF